MSYAWQTVEQAAVTLGCSTRTINRRIKDNQIQSRLESGRREVLVCLPEGLKEPTPPLPSEDPTITARIDVSQTESSAAQRVTEATDAAARSSAYLSDDVSEASDAPATVPAEVLALTEERVRRAEMAVVAFRQTATLYQSEAARARFGAKFAWAIVAVMALGTYVVVGWTTSQVSRSRAQTEGMSDRVRAASDASDKQAREVEQLRAQVNEASLARARAEGELAAIKEAEKAELAADRQGEKRVGQTNVLQKLANLWVEE